MKWMVVALSIGSTFAGSPAAKAAEPPARPAVHREPRARLQGHVRLGVRECALSAQPLITLTLSPAIRPGSRATLIWDVRDRRPGIAWGYPVHIQTPAGLPIEMPDPAPRSGQRTFTAVAGVLRAGESFALETRCGRKTVPYDVTP